MGCGWKRWKDEVGIERLKIVQAAWQEKTTVFAKVMRGAVWSTQLKSSADGLILETKFVDHGNAAVEDSWLGRLWKWMSSSNLQLKLKGRKAMVRCRAGAVCGCDRSIAYGTGRVGRPMRKGCATFGVSKWSDVLMRDGKTLRREMREGGEWVNKVCIVDRKTDSEWAMKDKERVAVESCAEGRESCAEGRHAGCGCC
jgi:hypothetical protein